MQGVGTCVAVERVVPVLTLQVVRTVTSIQGVVAIASLQGVTAVVASENIPCGVAGEGVAAGPSDQRHGLDIGHAPNGGGRIGEANLLDLPAAGAVRTEVVVDAQLIGGATDLHHQEVTQSVDHYVGDCDSGFEDDLVNVACRGVGVVDRVYPVISAKKITFVTDPAVPAVKGIHIVTGERVIASTTIKRVITGPALKQIVATTSAQYVVPSISRK